MKVIKSRSSYNPNRNEWTVTQTERQQKGIGLELALLSCTCSATSLLLIEHGQLLTIWNGSEDLTDASFEALKITCPGCGAEVALSVPAINSYDGASVRILESWSAGVHMTGLPDTVLDDEQTIRISASVAIPKFFLRGDTIPLSEIEHRITDQLAQVVTRHISAAIAEMAQQQHPKPDDELIF